MRSRYTVVLAHYWDARRASRPSPRIVGRQPPRRARAMRRMFVELRTSHHVLIQRLGPTHFDAHRFVAFMQREHVCTQGRSVANASAHRLGRTQNPMPARVMKKTGRGHLFEVCSIPPAGVRV
jgi:hypothetical protein